MNVSTLSKKVGLLVCSSLFGVSVFAHTESGEEDAKYIKQEPPGYKAKAFEPEDQSEENSELAGSFSQNGDQFVYTKVVNKSKGVEYVEYEMHIENEEWTKPQPLEVEKVDVVCSPSFHPGDNKMYFGSYSEEADREDPKKDMDVFVAEVKDRKVVNPYKLGDEVNSSFNDLHPSVDSHGNLYFYSDRIGGKGGWDIYMSEFANGSYKKAVCLGNEINTKGDEYNPCISPDGNILLFTSGDRLDKFGSGHDIFVSYKEENGWTEAQNAGRLINSESNEWNAYFSADNKYIFFTSDRNTDENNPKIYWISVDALGELRRGKKAFRVYQTKPEIIPDRGLDFIN